MDEQWYLLQCKARQEQRAEEHLQRQGVETFLPLYSGEKIRRGKRCTVTEPLFQGYLFMRFSQREANWRPIRSTRGVTRVVSFNNAPLPVPEGLVDSLKVQSATAATVKVLSAGDSVQIKHGPFRELDAVFCAYDGEERAIILLNIMHTRQKLSVPLNTL